jgi:preprotein translocase subunit YajC
MRRSLAGATPRGRRLTPTELQDSRKMDWLISTAAAQAPAGGQSALMQFLPLVLIFVVFYFLLIRPQSKRAKEHSAMVAALEAGAEVVTSGGILGKVVEVGDQFLTVEIADGVKVKVQRHTVSQVLPKGTLKSA